MQLLYRLGVCGLVTLGACSLDRSNDGPNLRDAATGQSTGGGVRVPDASMGAAGSTAGSGGSGVGGGVGGGGTLGLGDGGPSGALDGGPTLDGEASDAGPLGYVPSQIGAPCTQKSDCEQDRESRTCFTAEFFAPLLTLPGGYCGKLCSVGPGPACEPGAACITFPTFPPVLACMRRCTSDFDCRVAEGYSCNKPFTSTESVCSLPVN